MTKKVRFWVAGVMFAAVCGLISLSGRSHAEGDGDIKGAVIKIADAIKAGDKAGAQKIAAAAAKKAEEVADIMHMFRPRNKGGVGVGPKAGTNPTKDGIEVTLRDLARDVPTGVAKQADALEATGYYVAAIAELSLAKGWAKDQGKKTKKDWTKFSTELGSLGVAFAKASAAKGAQEIKTAAAKLNANCNACHSIYKE